MLYKGGVEDEVIGAIQLSMVYKSFPLFQLADSTSLVYNRILERC